MPKEKSRVEVEQCMSTGMGKNSRCSVFTREIIETNFLTSKLLKQGYRYHKLCKAFSKFYYQHSEFIVKYNICLKDSSATIKAYQNLFLWQVSLNLKELLESLILVINLKRLLNVIKALDTAWISCDSLHAWL